MKLAETPIPGAFVLEAEPIADERGFFARTWCRRDFEARGLCAVTAQCSVSYNRLRATLRGMHFQCAPHEEAKVVSCLRGSIFDVVVDLRPDSPAYLRWFATTLREQDLRSLYVPEGCAHGFLTLEDDAWVAYQISELYHPQSSRGVRWDDPALGIAWPYPPEVISERDRSFPLLTRAPALT
jgi:dTDP-4-dehydrorhamnose 3,5-epimerase